MSSVSIVICFESIFGTVLLRMAWCHIIAVPTVILGAVPFDVSGTVAFVSWDWDWIVRLVGMRMEWVDKVYP